MNTIVCARCAEPFEVNSEFYHFIQEPFPVECCVCRILARQALLRRGHGVRTASGALGFARKACPPLSAERSWTREQMLTALHQWICAHGKRFPTSTEIDADPSLPTAPTIRSRFGSFAVCAAVYQKKFPGYGWRPPEHTPATICAAIRIWMVTHPGRVPMPRDFKQDPDLPNPGIVYRWIGSLADVYTLLEHQGVSCLALYQRQLTMKRQTDGRKGAQMQAQRRHHQKEMVL